MMLAQLSGLEIGSIICAIVFGASTIVLALISIFKKTETVISPQPLIVAMQKEFASKHEFDVHVAHNHGVHDQIFSKIGGVERGAASSLEMKVEVVRKDLIHVGNQVSGLKAQTDLQNQQLARMDSKLDRLAEKS